MKQQMKGIVKAHYVVHAWYPIEHSQHVYLHSYLTAWLCGGRYGSTYLDIFIQKPVTK